MAILVHVLLVPIVIEVTHFGIFTYLYILSFHISTSVNSFRHEKDFHK